MIVRARKLPAGFAFPITRRRLREALRPFADHVDLVTFGGISFSEKPLKQQVPAQGIFWAWVGMAYAAWTEGSCRFCVSINGLRAERLAAISDPVEGLIALDLTQFVERTLHLRETDPVWGRATSCHLSFRLSEDGELESRSFVS